LWYIIKNKRIRKKNNQNIRPFFSPNKKKILQKLKNIKGALKKKCIRATLKINRLQNELNEVQIRMKNVSRSNLEEILISSNISKSQTELITEIFNAARIKILKTGSTAKYVTLYALPNKAI